jgi:hypothetical protein
MSFKDDHGAFPSMRDQGVAMPIVTFSRRDVLSRLLGRLLPLTAISLLAAVPAYAADPGKAACMPDAKRLCAAEMNSLSRSKVRACLIAHMEQTTPVCHDFMVKAREQAMAAHKPEPSTQ